MSKAHLIIGPSEYLIEKWNGGWRFGKYETTKDGKKRIFEWSKKNSPVRAGVVRQDTETGRGGNARG